MDYQRTLLPKFGLNLNWLANKVFRALKIIFIWINSWIFFPEKENNPPKQDKVMIKFSTCTQIAKIFLIGWFEFRMFKHRLVCFSIYNCMCVCVFILAIFTCLTESLWIARKHFCHVIPSRFVVKLFYWDVLTSIWKGLSANKQQKNALIKVDFNCFKSTNNY